MNRAADQSEANPLREGLSTRAVPQPCSVVIFGATGDLTHRKLLPALYNLAADGELPPAVAVIGFARREMSDEAGFKSLAERLDKIDKERGTRGNRLFYFAVAPDQFEPILKHLKTAGLNEAKEGSWARVIIEKPFGTDLDSARELNR